MVPVPRFLRLVVLSALGLALAGPGFPLTAQDTAPVPSEHLAALQPRPIGPAVTGGRIHDVEAIPSDPSVIFAATASGGLWKSTNRGITWRNVFDTMAVSTFGDVSVAPSDHQILYAGTGEQNNRQSTSWGNGVYRSDDGGESWQHLGLTETRHIGKVRVHPSNPDVVYVAALGNLWAPSQERGVFRSRDGGESWEKILFVDEHTGAVDLVMNPRDPDVLYAATYQRLRRAWGFNGGGPGSGIYKTTDGGETWTELTNGIPQGDKGRIGLALAYSNPQVLNAVIQHADEDQEGTYRSQDGGESWERVNPLNPRPMYYSHIFIDPTNEDRVYVLGTSSYKSEDGGRTFDGIAVRPTYDVGVHADHHTLWIDPNDPDHLYLAGDAGFHESYDRGDTFRKINNFVIGQFYGIGVDMREPYYVYGGMQDNHSWLGPSRTRRWVGIVNDDWKQIGFGDGMYWQIDPTSARYAYGNSQNGNYTRVDAYTGDILDISPVEPAGEDDYRFDWVSPSLVSAHDPSTVYVGGNRLFTSRDRGLSWERTRDLTRQVDRDTLELMGVEGADITLSRNDGTSSYGEIVTIAESPLDAEILWVGTDDGNLQVSRDGGETWTEVGRNVQGVPDGTYVSRVTASVAGEGVAYATFDAHRDGDFAPYVFRTEDFGASWEPLMEDLPSGSVNDIVEHPDAPHVLFLGTEHHLFASTDAGANWARWEGMPTTHYDDILIHPREKDLVLGTHGRSIWILDDTRPLAEWTGSVAASAAHIFSVRDAIIFQYWKDTSYRGQAEYAGENPLYGALITYKLGSGSGSAFLTIRGPNGEVIRRYEVPGEEGLHRVNWDLRYPADPGGGPERWTHFQHEELPRSVGPQGYLVSPGRYTATLEARGTTVSTEIRVLPDPEMPLETTQYQEREAFLKGLTELEEQITEASAEAGRIREDTPVRDEEMAEIQGELRELQGTVRGVGRSLMGGGVRPGTLYPPTETHRTLIQRVRDRLREIQALIEG